MLHLIMTLMIQGACTERVKCPDSCTCIGTLVSEATVGAFDVANITEPAPELEGFGTTEPDYKIEILGDNRTFPGDRGRTAKCGKSKDAGGDIFLRDFSTKPQDAIGPEDARTKRTADAEESEGGAEGKAPESSGDEVSTYEITCEGLRDLKPLWSRRLPSPATRLNIRETHFQSFKAFRQILREGPRKLSRLTVLSVSDSVINQTADKKYSFKTESTNKEEIGERGSERPEFLPFASLQNPKPRSKPEMGFPPKGKCKNLQVLNLANNTITFLPEDTFRPFLNLQILNLSSNLIELLEKETFASLANLLRLDLHDNRLRSLDEILFKNLTKLLFLDVSQNLISGIPPSTFQYLPSLNVLDLAGNPLSEKQEATILLGTGKRLQVVDISRTGLKQIPGTLERSVRALNLRGNLLLSVRCGDLDSYSLLSYLNLRGNKISYVEDDALGRLELLNNLQISENNLFQIPKSLPNNLEILNLSYNNIQNITNLDFLNLSLLKELWLSYNQVSNIEESAFNNLPRLKVLDLSRNPILVLPAISGRIRLSSLNLSYFTNIPGAFSPGYKQFPVRSPQTVKHLNLESSPVLTKTFLRDTDTLELFADLEELDVRFSNLTTIRQDIFTLLPKLRSLKVEGNPWHCGREILVLSAWLRSHERAAETEDGDDVNTAHCLTPARLYKTTLTALREEDFQEQQPPKASGNKTTAQLEKPSSEAVFGSGTAPEAAAASAVKKVNVKKYSKTSGKLKTNRMGENCCGKFPDKPEVPSAEKISTVVPPMPSESTRVWRRSHDPEMRGSSSSSPETGNGGTALRGDVRYLSQWTSTEGPGRNDSLGPEDSTPGQAPLRTAKNAEAVTARDSLPLKKEYDSHLSFLVLSSVGLVVMATLTFTSVYFTRTRRDQSYQRQHQDIEVCSISSLGNELW